MKGDFTRVTFRPRNHYSGVLQQQGRVQLDADWNEQVAIDAYVERTTTRDLIGGCGAPCDAPGFALTCDGAADPGRGLRGVRAAHRGRPLLRRRHPRRERRAGRRSAISPTSPASALPSASTAATSPISTSGRST